MASRTQTMSRVGGAALLIGERSYGGRQRSREFEAPALYVGEGAYDGMIAIMESSLLEGDCGADVRGVLFSDGPVPEPYNLG